MKKAVIIFSGGLDSTTCLALAKSQGFECYALSFDYGQRHNIELEAAKKIAKHYQAQHKIFHLDISQFGGSALTDKNIDVPDYNPADADEIPVTYVPARNTIFLSIALAWAEVVGASDIFLGISAIDYSKYPDCRPEYLAAYQHMADLATKASVESAAGKIKIHAPLIQLSKADTIKLGDGLGVDYSLTVSCYRADHQGRACGKCDSCSYRKKGFNEAGVTDSTVYA